MKSIKTLFSAPKKKEDEIELKTENPPDLKPVDFKVAQIPPKDADVKFDCPVSLDPTDSVQYQDSSHRSEHTTASPKPSKTPRESNFAGGSPSTWSWFRKTEAQKTRQDSVTTQQNQKPPSETSKTKESVKVSFVSLFNATPLLSFMTNRKASVRLANNKTGEPSTETQTTEVSATVQKPHVSINQRTTSRNRTSTDEQQRKSQTHSNAATTSSIAQQKSSFIKPSNTNQRVAFLDSSGYQLERDIDSGAFANVYLAKSKTSKKMRSVAVKRVNIVAKQNKKFVHNFLAREVYIHSKLLHPCIIQFYQGLYSETDLYMILEWVPRGNMLDYCRLKGRLSEGTAARVMYQICSGLAYMHLNDVCHRDIKCENVLLMSTEPLNIKIADFGFAKMLGPKTSMNPPPGSDLQAICEKQCKEEPLSYGSDGIFSVVSSNCNMNSKLKQKTEQAKENTFCTSTFCGSLAYSAPELVMGKMYDGRKVDSWSTGCILFIMLTHRMAFREKNGNRALVQQQLAGVKWPQNSFDKISTEAKLMIEWILTFDHRERPFTDQILNHHWFAPYRLKIQEDIKEIVQERSGTSLAEKARRTRRKSMSESAIHYH